MGSWIKQWIRKRGVPADWRALEIKAGCLPTRRGSVNYQMLGRQPDCSEGHCWPPGVGIFLAVAKGKQSATWDGWGFWPHCELFTTTRQPEVWLKDNVPGYADLYVWWGVAIHHPISTWTCSISFTDVVPFHFFYRLKKWLLPQSWWPPVEIGHRHTAPVPYVLGL